MTPDRNEVSMGKTVAVTAYYNNNFCLEYDYHENEYILAYFSHNGEKFTVGFPPDAIEDFMDIGYTMKVTGDV